MAGDLPPESGAPPASAPPPASKPSVRVFQCPGCGATLNIKAVGQTITVGCGSCGATLDTSREDVQLVEKGQVLKRRIDLPIGTRGQFEGSVFEILGVMGRHDEASGYAWKEYLLFNPYQGFRWLSEAGGQWSYVSPLKGVPKVDDSISFKTGMKPRAELGGRTFVHFQNSVGIVDFVIGEFYWRVRKGDKSKLADYVDPPDLLSCETNESERIWTRCTYLTPEAVGAAFRLPNPLPYAIGVAPNQPNPYLERWRGLRDTWFLFTIAILVLFVLHKIRSPHQELFEESLHYEPTATAAEKVVRLGPYEITGNGNFELDLHADLNNSYFDADVDLVNDSTGEAHDMQVGAEYWSGYDSDGSWSEGSTSGDDLETGIGPGTYHLVITPSAANGANTPTPVSYRLKGVRGVSVGSNFFLAWLILSVYPLFTFFRSSAFESERWSNSDYAPSDSGDGDDWSSDD
ncbi:MAG: DUF4178 domain-containing protein [Bdellovibrionales bacterium]|nr:DUF4178 domain-containing protein [Bdellovibrionales bacterium]